MKLEADQIEFYEALSRIVMSWVAFLAAGAVTVVFLCIFLWCLFKRQDTAAKVLLGLVDSFLLSLLRIIYKHVFFDRSEKKTANPQEYPKSADASKAIKAPKGAK